MYGATWKCEHVGDIIMVGFLRENMYEVKSAHGVCDKGLDVDIILELELLKWLKLWRAISPTFGVRLEQNLWD